jgi:preprotein translocase subunit SecF
MWRKTIIRRIHYISSANETADKTSARNDQQECGMQGSKGRTRVISRFIGDASGASLIEYALIAALVSVVVIITLLALLGPKT